MNLRFIPKNERISRDDISTTVRQETDKRSVWKSSSLKYPTDAQVNKKNRRRNSRIHFDWDPKDDTSRDIPASIDLIPSKKDPLIAESHQHWANKGLAEMTRRDWRILREDFDISVSGGALSNIPDCLRYWKESTHLIDSTLLRTLRHLGYDEPRPIQRQAIPIALTGIDFIGLAETGSGKTAAYLLPVLQKIVSSHRIEQRQRTKKNDGDHFMGPIGLVLAPTRELALQIEVEAQRLSQSLHGIIIVTLIGGHSLTEQSMQLRNGADIVIATPGRLRDCLEQRVLSLKDCKCLVLDEADRMIDLNYEEDMDFILETCNRASPICQMSMYSATMHPSVEKIATKRLKAPFMIIRIGETGLAVESVRQKLIWVSSDAEKASLIVDILGYAEDAKFEAPIIVFVNQRSRVEKLAQRMEALGWRVATLFGDKSQVQREMAIDSVRRGQSQVLVATDVAGRGIDIPGVTLVFNYDLPKCVGDYVHRIGRTGRAGLVGNAISLITGDDASIFYDLKKSIIRSKNYDPLPIEFANHEATMHRPSTTMPKYVNTL